MPYDDTLIVDHIKRTHSTVLLSEPEKHLIRLTVTMTQGCQSPKEDGKSGTPIIWNDGKRRP